MTRDKILIIALAAASLASAFTSCDSEKSRIENAMHDHVKSDLLAEESFAFIGLSNRRDTVFMGETRPCAGVIYKVANATTGKKERRYADVIFSNDYREVLSFTELDYDPIDYAGDKIKSALKARLALPLLCLIMSVTAFAKPHCQSFNNYDDKVTVVFSDDKAGKSYRVSDARFVTYGKQYKADSVKVSVKNGVATVTLTFPHVTRFSNPKVKLNINGRKTGFKVCQ